MTRRVRWQLGLTGVLTNGVGASVVVAFMLFVAANALSARVFHQIERRSIPVYIAYMAITIPLGSMLIQERPLNPIRRWIAERRPANHDDRERVLRYPRDWALKGLGFWIGGAVLFSLLNLGISAAAALGIAISTLLGALTACSLQYLIVERIMRPITALALEEGLPERTGAPGVALRITMAWTLATAVPVLGIVAFAVLYKTNSRLSTPAHADHLVLAMLFLALLALAAGLAAMLIATQSVAQPLSSMRRALAGVEAGQLETRTPVEDASEVGLLQAGFNTMAAGLADRERLRDAFGAFVDPSLTERVLREGVDLAGEEVELTLLFLDVRGFTAFSERARAHEVVSRLNELYEHVVPIVLRHGGHASKFIGDGLLAVFGAPDRLPDHAPRAVAAGLEIVALVNRRYGGELHVGVGINSGAVVAGTIGGGGRVDFTVIGDPVNTAARVEAATRETGDDLLITDATLELLGGRGPAWVERPEIAMKGKTDVVRLFAPGVKGGAGARPFATRETPSRRPPPSLYN